jgi:hypothetical protein
VIPAVYRAPGFMTRHAAKVIGRMVARKRGASWALVFFRDADNRRRWTGCRR